MLYKGVAFEAYLRLISPFSTLYMYLYTYYKATSFLPFDSVQMQFCKQCSVFSRISICNEIFCFKKKIIVVENFVKKWLEDLTGKIQRTWALDVLRKLFPSIIVFQMSGERELLLCRIKQKCVFYFIIF